MGDDGASARGRLAQAITFQLRWETPRCRFSS